MKRGELWTSAGGPDFAGKPRPVVIIQDDSFDETASITVCLLTSQSPDLPLFRLHIEPSPQNGLQKPSQIMIDKVSTLERRKVVQRIGELSDMDLRRLDQALLIFLGLV